MPKYKPYPIVGLKDRTWPDQVIQKAPRWCSVDLRDGNQALPIPMNISQKLTMFRMLLDIGFREIEVGFPSASQIEYDFQRQLIEGGLIPQGVAIQVLTQAREHLIEKTVESLQGARKAIIHIYNSTSEQQRRITFKKNKAEIKQMAVDGVRQIIELLPKLAGTEVILEYSPESFTGTELEYALEVCEEVTSAWEPRKRGKIILNLPSTVELSTPNVFADRIEWFCRNLSDRPNVILSVHAHNDRGTGVATAELSVMAGADRIEGTLFGNGERTGNLDIVTMGLNLLTQGIAPDLNFGDIPKIREIYETCTGLLVPPRQPYAGDLVFTAFSGSHQDAISKGLALVSTDQQALWDVPYLPIDPKDIGRTYDAIIRVNSQSGKGGVAFVLLQEYGIRVPRPMQPELGQKANEVSDRLVKELTAQEIYEIFENEFVNRSVPFSMGTFYLIRSGSNVQFKGELVKDGRTFEVEGTGNGPIDAFTHGLEKSFGLGMTLVEYEEQSLGRGSGSEAMAFIALQDPKGRLVWGCGQGTDTAGAGFWAYLSALNRALVTEPAK